jgi:low temperature requirement protein LtrA
VDVPAPEREPGDEHEVTPLELFFDLVFVFAITQVTKLLTSDPTWGGLLRGMLVLAAVWWAWTTYAWLTSAIDVDEGAVRLTMLASTAIMLGVALAVPRAFGADAVLFGVAYFLVRLIHFALSAVVGRDDPDRRSTLLRFGPTALLGSSLILLAGFVHGDARIASGRSLWQSTTSGRPLWGWDAAGRWRPSTSPSATG